MWNYLLGFDYFGYWFYLCCDFCISLSKTKNSLNICIEYYCLELACLIGKTGMSNYVFSRNWENSTLRACPILLDFLSTNIASIILNCRTLFQMTSNQRISFLRSHGIHFRKGSFLKNTWNIFILHCRIKQNIRILNRHHFRINSRHENKSLISECFESKSGKQYIFSRIIDNILIPYRYIHNHLIRITFNNMQI